MSDVIYRSREYIIIRKKHKQKLGFVVINTKKDFSDGHTHVTNYNTAKMLVKLSKNSKMPKSKSEYFLQSLIRISKDKQYIDRLKEVNNDVLL